MSLESGGEGKEESLLVHLSEYRHNLIFKLTVIGYIISLFLVIRQGCSKSVILIHKFTPQIRKELDKIGITFTTLIEKSCNFKSHLLGAQ